MDRANIDASRVADNNVVRLAYTIRSDRCRVISDVRRARGVASSTYLLCVHVSLLPARCLMPSFALAAANLSVLADDVAAAAGDVGTIDAAAALR